MSVGMSSDLIKDLISEFPRANYFPAPIRYSEWVANGSEAMIPFYISRSSRAEVMSQDVTTVLEDAIRESVVAAARMAQEVCEEAGVSVYPYYKPIITENKASLAPGVYLGFTTHGYEASFTVIVYFMKYIQDGG